MTDFESRITSDDENLLRVAESARERAYAPYSDYPVGAALRTSDDTIYEGVNVENASYGLSMCAERTAIFKAVADGARDLESIAIVGKTDGEISPCGACRQVMREFNAEMTVIVKNEEDGGKKLSLDELLPNSFGPDSLQ